jgi:hypothetical protein
MPEPDACRIETGAWSGLLLLTLMDDSPPRKCRRSDEAAFNPR